MEPSISQQMMNHIFNEFKQIIDSFDMFSLNKKLLTDILSVKTDFEQRWTSLGKDVTHLSYQLNN